MVHPHDRDPAFRWCVDICSEGDGCVMLPPALKHTSVDCSAACPAQFDRPVPRAVQLLRWSCADDCKCVHSMPACRCQLEACRLLFANLIRLE